MFWSGVDLTGNQTIVDCITYKKQFWSGVDLTGNQTLRAAGAVPHGFWSGVDLTGNQTVFPLLKRNCSFGAVSI